MTEGEPLSYLCIAITGSAEVRKQGARIGELRPGQTTGTAVALTGDPSPVEVTFSEPARYMRWSLPNLRGFMDKRPDLRGSCNASSTAILPPSWSGCCRHRRSTLVHPTKVPFT